MLSRFPNAVRAAARGIDDAFGWLFLWGPLVPMIVLGAATILAVFSHSPLSFGLRFAAGIVTSIFYLVVACGSLMSLFFFTGLSWKLFSSPASERWSISNPKDGFAGIFWLVGSLMTGLWIVPLALATAQIPIVQDQLLPF